jgi:hypothetical protein
MGLAAAWSFAAGRRALGGLFAATLLSIGTFPEAFHRIDPDLGLWWDPLAISVVALVLAARILRGRRPGAITEAG